MVTVTGTENLMMAAALAEGETVLENAAREPEVVDLAALLIAMGAKIEGAGTDRIVIQGVRALHGATHAIMPDRIEAGTFLVRGRGHRRRRRAAPAPTPTSSTPCSTSCARPAPTIDDRPTTIRVRDDRRAAARSSLRTAPYPGLPDRHAGAVHGARHASPTARRVITETIFENRFMHVQELHAPGRRHRGRGQHRGRQRRRAA